MEKNNTYEVHIAATEATPSQVAELKKQLAEIGISKTKFFNQVKNILPAGATGPSTDHDLATPGTMSTIHVSSFDEAKSLVTKGMNILQKMEIEGNFEIEQVTGPYITPHKVGDITTELPGYKSVGSSPEWENHILWKGTTLELPSFEEIIAFAQEHFQVQVDQIVDFSYAPDVAYGTNDPTIISRVATKYQPNRDATLDLQKKLHDYQRAQVHQPKSTKKPLRMVSEQVIWVGEPK